MDNKINLLLGFDLERARAAAGVERTYLARALTRGRRKVVANTVYGWERLGKTPTKEVIASLKKLFEGAEKDFPVTGEKWQPLAKRKKTGSKVIDAVRDFYSTADVIKSSTINKDSRHVVGKIIT